MELTVGSILEGKVKSITNFGAFVALPDNKTGMVHISEVANTYVTDIRQHLTEGQEVKVVVIAVDGNKINLSIKRLEAQRAEKQQLKDAAAAGKKAALQNTYFHQEKANPHIQIPSLLNHSPSFPQNRSTMQSLSWVLGLS